MFITVTSRRRRRERRGPRRRHRHRRATAGIAHVAEVNSAWTAPPPAAPALISKDGKTGLIVAGITGGENGAQKHAKTAGRQLVHDRDGVTVRAGGEAMTTVQVNSQSEKDLLLMESIAMPLSFVVLVWVFGGLLAAALPLAVGGFAILGSMAVLRAIALVTDVSIFALNLTVAMGLALAIDYTLLIVSRFRDELAGGADRDEALMRTMATAGRTVLFSAMTVALSMVGDGAVPDVLPEVVRLCRHRGGGVRGGCRDRGDARRRSCCSGTGWTRWTCAGWPAGCSAGRSRAAARSSRSSGIARRNS